MHSSRLDQLQADTARYVSYRNDAAIVVLVMAVSAAAFALMGAYQSGAAAAYPIAMTCGSLAFVALVISGYCEWKRRGYLSHIRAVQGNSERLGLVLPSQEVAQGQRSQNRPSETTVVRFSKPAPRSLGRDIHALIMDQLSFQDGLRFMRTCRNARGYEIAFYRSHARRIHAPSSADPKQYVTEFLAEIRLVDKEASVSKWLNVRELNKNKSQLLFASYLKQEDELRIIKITRYFSKTSHRFWILRRLTALKKETLFPIAAENVHLIARDAGELRTLFELALHYGFLPAVECVCRIRNKMIAADSKRVFVPLIPSTRREGVKLSCLPMAMMEMIFSYLTAADGNRLAAHTCTKDGLIRPAFQNHWAKRLGMPKDVAQDLPRKILYLHKFTHSIRALRILNGDVRKLDQVEIQMLTTHLIERDGHINYLFKWASSGNAHATLEKILQYLVQTKRQHLLNAQYNNGRTPIYDAIFYCDDISVDLLIKYGANLNIADDSGYTPLMYASAIVQPDTNIIQSLLKGGADVHAQLNGQNVLKLAQDSYPTQKMMLTLLEGWMHNPTATLAKK